MTKIKFENLGDMINPLDNGVCINKALEKEKIFIIDDSSLYRQQLMNALNNMGAEIVEVTTNNYLILKDCIEVKVGTVENPSRPWFHRQRNGKPARY